MYLVICETNYGNGAEILEAATLQEAVDCAIVQASGHAPYRQVRISRLVTLMLDGGEQCAEISAFVAPPERAAPSTNLLPQPPRPTGAAAADDVPF